MIDINKLKKSVENNNIEWYKHAFERMMERGISRDTVKKVLLTGEVIENYPEDKPYPSMLFLGWVEGEPYHVVVAFNPEDNQIFIITAYRPDLEHFEPDYKTRR